MLKKGILLGAACLFASVSFANTLSEKEFKTWLQQTMAEKNIPGVSIAIVKDFEVSEAEGFGRVRAGDKKAVDKTTRFQAGDISEVITASTALLAARDHKLLLGAPVNRFLTSARIDDNNYSRRRALTIKRILNDSSGTNVDKAPFYRLGEPVPTTTELFTGATPATNDKVVVIETPGSSYKPSAGGYIVMQQIFEDVYEKPFASVVKDIVFEPLAMTHSGFSNDRKALQNFAKPHNAGGEFIESGPRQHPVQAANGLWTTPSDMAHWMVAGQKAYVGDQNQVFHPRVAKKLFNANFKHRSSDIPDTSYGLVANLNAFAEKEPKGPFFMKFGETTGYQAIVFGNKKTGEGAVIMLNKSATQQKNQHPISFEILNKIAQMEGWGSSAATTGTA